MQNRLKCQFYAGTCEKLIPYIEVRPIKDSQDRQRRRGDADVCEQKLRKYCLEHTDKEINLLKQLIHVPDGFLPENRNRICGFQQMDIEY